MIQLTMESDISCNFDSLRLLLLVFNQIASLLDLDVDEETITLFYNLIDCGVNPDALASIIKELKQSQ